MWTQCESPKFYLDYRVVGGLLWLTLILANWNAITYMSIVFKGVVNVPCDDLSEYIQLLWL